MSLKEKLATLLNSASVENGSNTPDFILAEYMLDCLSAFEKAVNAREKWYGRNKEEQFTLKTTPEVTEILKLYDEMEIKP